MARRTLRLWSGPLARSAIVLLLVPAYARHVGAEVVAGPGPPEVLEAMVGQRVRVTHAITPVHRSDGKRSDERAVVVGTLRADDGQRVAITVKGQDDPVFVASGSIRRFEVWRGRRSLAREGGVIGGALGGLLGILFGAACYATCFDDDEGLGAKGLVGATALLGGIGAVFGAVVAAPFRTDKWEHAARQPVAPPVSSADREGFRLAPFAALGANRFVNVFPSFQNPVAPAGTAGLQADLDGGPDVSLRVEWLPQRTFREHPFEGGTSRTEMALVSVLAGLHGRGGRRWQPALLVGVSRQSALDSLDHPTRGRALRDRTWCVTLGGDLEVKVAGPVSIVPQFRWDTDGGRVTSGMQLRASLAIKGTF